jgi:Cu/Ag efflux pump CusA
VVAIALVLSAVFIPVAFLGGLTGALYRQFALTLATSVILSAVAALTLAPALCALLLRPASHDRPSGMLGRFFAWFNGLFAAFTKGYVGSTAVLIRRAALVALTFAVLLVAIYGLLKIVTNQIGRLWANTIDARKGSHQAAAKAKFPLNILYQTHDPTVFAAHAPSGRGEWMSPMALSSLKTHTDR